jgi:hypothetical protein
MIYFCCDLLRRSAVRGSALNGIDFLEVVDLEAPAEADRQRFLHVHLLNDPGALVFDLDEVRIEGGERIRGIEVVDVQMGLGPQANVVVVEVDRRGDFSPYRLRLVRGLADDRSPPGFDPQLAAVEFSFKAECPTDFDCRPLHVCPPPEERPPLIDYLAKDYESLRRLMLDRMATLAPSWEQRNPADLGVTLVELLAYVGDEISYAQDSAFAEGFLDRARSRVSARRLARLVDYRMSEGVNARTYVHFAVSADVTPLLPDEPVLPARTAVTTLIAGQDIHLPADPAVIARAAVVFETMRPVQALFLDHNRMPFYAWGDRRCCLPKGATRATLAGHYPNLRVGETLIFEEIVGPRTGRPADADPARRHPVRLVSVEAIGEGGGPLTDPLTGDRVTEIAWAGADALPCAFCLSAETDEAFGALFIEPVSVARGNVVLADHGRIIEEEALGPVPESGIAWAAEATAEPCDRPRPRAIPPRFLPQLAERPVTHAIPRSLGDCGAAAGSRPRDRPDLARKRARRRRLERPARPPGEWPVRRRVRGRDRERRPGLSPLRRRPVRPPAGAGHDVCRALSGWPGARRQPRRRHAAPRSLAHRGDHRGPQSVAGRRRPRARDAGGGPPARSPRLQAPGARGHAPGLCRGGAAPGDGAAGARDLAAHRQLADGVPDH